jgi:hypothetical protein
VSRPTPTQLDGALDVAFSLDGALDVAFSLSACYFLSEFGGLGCVIFYCMFRVPVLLQWGGADTLLLFLATNEMILERK